MLELLSAYIPPDPAENTCVHRYSIYIYQQSFDPIASPEVPSMRSEFDIQDFVENVIPAGAFCGPVASIEFQSRF